MTHILELTVTMASGKQHFDFCQIGGVDTREQAIAIQKDCLETRIKRAKLGNPVWANNSANYAEWLTFTLE